MDGVRSPLSLLLACVLALLGDAPAHGASATFVSQATGLNTNNCTSPATPCETLLEAYGKTDPGGVIHVLPGEYSSLEINKAVEIIADGGRASITSSSNGGVNTSGRFYVEAGPTDDVRIRGFTLKAGSGGVVGPVAGISFVAAGSLYVEDCILIDSTGNYGLLFLPTGASELYVSNSVVSDNSGGGILIKPSGSASAKATIDDVRLEDNLSGIVIDGRATTGTNTVTIRNSVVSGSSTSGIYAADSGGGATNVTVEGSTSNNNTTFGIGSNGVNSFVRVRNSTVTGNGTGLQIAGSGKIVSLGGNSVTGNTTNGAFTSTVAQQ